MWCGVTQWREEREEGGKENVNPYPTPQKTLAKSHGMASSKSLQRQQGASSYVEWHLGLQACCPYKALTVKKISSVVDCLSLKLEFPE